MSSVTVFGATGYAGRAITEELLDRGHSVVGVARSVDSLPARAGLRTVAGSLFTPAVLAEATRGADVIIVALPALSGDGLASAVPELLATAGEARARLAFVGGAGSLQVAPGGHLVVESPDFPEQFKGEALAHKAVLDTLRGSGTDVDWFYVSPAAGFGSYNPGSRIGQFRVGGDVLLTDGDGGSNLSAADLAIAFADEIDKPAHHRERYTVAY